MNFELIPFQDELLGQAAELLANRHRHTRRLQPELPERLEDPTEAAAALQVARQRPYARGLAAVNGSRLLGYLTGDLDLGPIWGRSAWVRAAGYAVAEGQSLELLRDLYAALGDFWLRAGSFYHCVQVPAQDADLVRIWFSLNFGIEHVRAIQALEGIDLQKPELPEGVEICQAGSQERELMADFSDVIWSHQVLSPVWAIHVPEDTEREGWAELADDPEVVAWLAKLDGRPAAAQSFYPSELSKDLMFLPENCAHLAAAGTRPWARRRGLMAALTRNGLADLYERGYRWCETDWRSTNLLSSRYWPTQGFKPAIYRLTRRIDERIAWANGQIQI